MELGLGTGIISIELARAGCRVTGIENSQDMLDIASDKTRTEPAEAQARLRLVLGDVEDFHLNDEFHIIFIASNTLGYLFRLQYQRSYIRAMRKHLSNDGLIVIEEGLYLPELLASRWRTEAILLYGNLVLTRKPINTQPTTA